MFLFGRVISRERVIKGTCGLVSWSLSAWVTNLPRLVLIGHTEVEIKQFEFFVFPNKEVMFRKCKNRFGSLKIT